MRKAPLLLAAVLLHAACAASSWVPRAPVVVPSPPAVDHRTGSFEGVWGDRLFEQSWRPRTPARAVVVLVHGLKDYGNHYATFAEELVSRGYAVHSFDLRGHGNSEGRRVYLCHFDDYLNDLDIFLARVRAAEPGLPIFLFGHSMGGAIVTLYTEERKPALAGLMLSAPALKVTPDVSGATVGFTKFLGAIFPRLAVFKLDDTLFSRDPAVVAAMHTDPLISDGAAPARTAASLLKAMSRIEEATPSLTVPLLVLHGGADKVTNPDGSRDLVARAPAKDKTLKIYDGFYHDLLHEPDRAKVSADLLAWLDAHAPAPPAK